MSRFPPIVLSSPSAPEQIGSRAAALVALLLALAWLVTEHFPPWTNFHSELPALLAGSIAVVYALTRRGPLKVGPAAAGLLLVALVPWLQWVTGLVLFRGDAALASAYLAGMALCLWAGDAMPPPARERLLYALAWTMLGVAIASTGIGLCQWFGIDGLGPWIAHLQAGSRTAGNLAQSNHMATLFAFALASTVLLHARGRLGGMAAMSTAAFLLLGLAMTQSRTPWLGVLLLGGWMLLRPASLLQPLRLRPVPLLLLAGWYALVLWGTAVLPEPLLLAGIGRGDTLRIASGGRPVMWASWWHAIQLAPWFGHGWQQGHLAQGLAALEAPAYAYSGYAHNLVLDLLAWNGLPLGGLLVAGGAWWYFRSGLRASGPEQWFRFAVLSLFLAHALLEYPHAYTYLLVPVALLAGQLGAEMPGEWRLAVPRWPLAAAAVLCMGIAVAVVHDYFLIEADTRDLRAQKMHIGGVWTSEAPKDILVLDQMLALARAIRIEPRASMPPAELRELLQVARRFPTRYLLQQSAAALALNGRAREAHVEMRRLAGMYGPAGHAASVAALRMRAEGQDAGLQAFVDEIMPASLPTAH